jgi:hypothetical protein
MKKTLLYRTVEHNGALVFAAKDRARLVARMNTAIDSARTWAEFRRAMPAQEYAAVVYSFDERGEPRPKGADAFSGEQLPGWTDGDFPPWLQSEMEYLLPQSILCRFGRRESTFINGGFWCLPPEAAPAIVAALEAEGWRVEHAPDLRFW